MHESGDLLDIALWGTLRFDAAGRCLYLGAQDKKILPAWSRVLDPGIKPVLRNGKRGIGTGGHGVIMEGDVLIAGGSGAERRDSVPQSVPESCAPQATWLDAFGEVIRCSAGRRRAGFRPDGRETSGPQPGVISLPSPPPGAGPGTRPRR